MCNDFEVENKIYDFKNWRVGYREGGEEGVKCFIPFFS